MPLVLAPLFFYPSDLLPLKLASLFFPPRFFATSNSSPIPPAPSGFSALETPFVVAATSPFYLAPLGLHAAGTISFISFFTTFCFGFFTLFYYMPFFSGSCHTISNSFSPMQVRYTLLPCKNYYAFQRLVSPLDTSKKQLQQETEKAN